MIGGQASILISQSPFEWVVPGAGCTKEKENPFACLNNPNYLEKNKESWIDLSWLFLEITNWLNWTISSFLPPANFWGRCSLIMKSDRAWFWVIQAPRINNLEGLVEERPCKISELALETWRARERLNWGFQFLVTLICISQESDCCLLTPTLSLTWWAWAILLCLEGSLGEPSGRRGANTLVLRMRKLRFNEFARPASFPLWYCPLDSNTLPHFLQARAIRRNFQPFSSFHVIYNKTERYLY